MIFLCVRFIAWIWKQSSIGDDIHGLAKVQFSFFLCEELSVLTTETISSTMVVFQGFTLPYTTLRIWPIGLSSFWKTSIKQYFLGIIMVVLLFCDWWGRQGRWYHWFLGVFGGVCQEQNVLQRGPETNAVQVLIDGMLVGGGWNTFLSALVLYSFLLKSFLHGMGVYHRIHGSAQTRKPSFIFTENLCGHCL